MLLLIIVIVAQKQQSFYPEQNKTESFVRVMKNGLVATY